MWLTILLIVLAAMLVLSLPMWPYSQNWGYGATSALMVTIFIILVLKLMGD